VREIAWKAQMRLCARFPSLARKGKRPTVVATAIACELSAFIWAYYAENKIIKSLPEMIFQGDRAPAQAGIRKHLGETRTNAKRLEDVFRMHGVEPKAIDRQAIDGIVEGAENVAGEVDNKQVMDAALVAAAQTVKHYEIARQRTLIAWAKQLGRSCPRPRANVG
jgi:ferritin-like metal-binding protein YciE